MFPRRELTYYQNGEELSVKAIWTLSDIIHFASELSNGIVK